MSLIHPIRYFGDPILRQPARPVREFDADLQRLAEDMIETMYAASGVGLAAPQIGVPLRLFVAVETDPTLAQDPEEDPEAAAVPPDRELTAAQKRERWGVVADWTMANPEIVARDGVQYGQEGCLSIPGLYVERMKRAERIRIRFQDPEGRTHERDAEGYFARILQHETDHLDGVLFFDRLPEAERIAFMETHRRELAEMQRESKALLRHLKRHGAAAPPG